MTIPALNTKRTRNLFAALLTVTGFASASPAQADATTYMGSHCKPVNTAISPTGLSYDPLSGGIENRSTSSTLTVLCPVVHHRTQGAPTVDILLLDRNPGTNDDIVCLRRAYDEKGRLIHVDSRKSNSSFSSPLPLRIRGHRFPRAESAIGLQCALPPATNSSSSGRSKIVSYRVLDR